MNDAIRTPDALLAGLPDLPFEPRRATFEGLRPGRLGDARHFLREDRGSHVDERIARWPSS